ncbi:aldo/keto reductase [Breznakiellaceae bacterium SP9]
MEKRHIDFTGSASLGIDVSLLGFGCMRLPLVGDDKAKIDYPLAQKMIDRAIKSGVNYFDTAWPYHDGMSEVFVGDTLSKYPRETYFLASKMPTWELIQSETDVERIFNEQLGKCKVDYFDFYLVHSLERDRMDRFQRFDMYNKLLKKKEEGKIKRLGFSFHDNAELLAQIVKEHRWDFAQIQLNYIDWDTLNAKGLYEILTQAKLPVIIMEPVRGGALATLNAKSTAILKEAAPTASTASWALRFAAALPNVMTVLSGMSSLEQVDDNLQTFRHFKPLTDSEQAVLAQAAAAFRASGTIPCTGCRYCMDCESGVDIPRVFSHYNTYQTTKERFIFDMCYRSLSDSQQPKNCIGCGECLKKCPQSIDIPRFMKEIAAFAAETV